MAKKGDWQIDVQSLSNQQIAELVWQLEGSGQEQLVFRLRRELVNRLRARGRTDGEIIRYLTRGVPRGVRLQEFAKAWAGIFNLSVEEFKRIANAK